MKLVFKKIVAAFLAIDSLGKVGNFIALTHSLGYCLMTGVIIVDLIMKVWIVGIAGGLLMLYAQYKIAIVNWQHVMRQESDQEVEPFSKESWKRLNSLGLRLVIPFAILGLTFSLYTILPRDELDEPQHHEQFHNRPSP